MIVELDKSNMPLAIEEIRSLSEVCQLVTDNYYFVKIKNPKNLGMTKRAYKIIGRLGSLKKIKGSFKAISHSTISNKEFAKIIWEKTEKKVDLKNPDSEIHLFNDIVAIKIWERKKGKKSHELISNHPTSTDPKISRAMINIANTKKVFDPFCGSGGILLEAVLMNKKAEGIDIDKIQIKRAKNNLSNYDVKLSVADSFNKKWPKTIVTDLPYGRNSKTQKDFFDKFFYKVKSCKLAVVGIPEGVDIPLSTKFETTIYLHKSLSKKIIVLEN